MVDGRGEFALPATVSKFRDNFGAVRPGAQRQSATSGCGDSSLSTRRIISCWPDSRRACPSRREAWPDSRRACPSRRDAWPDSMSRYAVIHFPQPVKNPYQQRYQQREYPCYRSACHSHQQRCPVHTCPHFFAVSAMVIEAPDSRHRQLSENSGGYSTSTTISTSTGARSGRPTMPTAERAWRPWSP